jgi:hypothetical protein
MGAFPEERVGVGGAVNDTSLELGGSLGIAILGSVLAGTYRSDLTTAIGGRLPAAAAKTAGDSVGGALAVAEKVAATAGPGRAAPLVHAADHAFAHAVAHTSLVGGLILGAGTVLVALLLPNARRPGAAPPAETPAARDREPSMSAG